MNSQLLNAKQVAARLSCSLQCVYSLVEHGLLPAVRIGIGRGVLRFTEDDIERFIQNCRSPKRRREPATRPA